MPIKIIRADITRLACDAIVNPSNEALIPGGDSDTLAAITGSVAEAYYGMTEAEKAKVFSFLDGELADIARIFAGKYMG